MISRFSLIGFLGVLLRLAVAFLSATAFGLSGTGKWIGSQSPVAPVPVEFIGGGIALLVMLAIVGINWRFTAVTRNLEPAVAGLAFHIPAILEQSSVNWEKLLPDQLSVLFVDSGMTDPLLLTTLLGVIVASILAFIVDSTREELDDLRDRGLNDTDVRVVVNQTVVLKIGALAVGLAVATGTYLAGSVFEISAATQASRLPMALMGFSGVLAIAVAVAMFFEARVAETEQTTEVNPEN